MDLEFYKKAFGATETKHLTNEDGSIHVSEMFIDGAMFHFHEESANDTTFSSGRHNGVTTTIGLMVADVDKVMAMATGRARSFVANHRPHCSSYYCLF
jgi:PhnB protein